MTNTEKTGAINKALEVQDLFICKSVDDVNHDPHPFTIGPRHIAYASKHHSSMLGEQTLEAVNCAFPKCNLPRKDHTSENVAFLQLLRKGTNDEAGLILKDLVTELGESFIDGFSFVETKEKFRIT